MTGNNNPISHFRLDRGDAVAIINQMSGRTIDQISELVSTGHPKAYPPNIITRTASGEELNSIRDGVLAIAERYGFPEKSKAKDASYSRFDVEVGNYLLDALHMPPSDAGMEETWNFLTLVLMPDIAAWRFHNSSKNPEYDRWIGRPRNVFRKSWWRAFCLGPDLNATLGEDEGVNIMERPTFGMNPALARAIAQVHRDHSGEYSLGRSELLRLVMVQLGKLVSIINLDALTDDEMINLVTDTYVGTARKFESMA